MSGGERIARIIGEIQAEITRLTRVRSDLEVAASGLAAESGMIQKMAVAGLLHGWYTGAEAVLARLARHFDVLPQGDGWHQALLLVSVAPVPGVHPPFLAATTAQKLMPLLHFRHFFRSSYGIDLDLVRLATLVALLAQADITFRADIESVLRGLPGPQA